MGRRFRSRLMFPCPVALELLTGDLPTEQTGEAEDGIIESGADRRSL